MVTVMQSNFFAKSGRSSRTLMAAKQPLSKSTKLKLGLGLGLSLLIIVVVLVVVFLVVLPGSSSKASGVSNLAAMRTAKGVTATFTPLNKSEPVVVYAAPLVTGTTCPSTPPATAATQYIGAGGTSTPYEIDLKLVQSQTQPQPQVCVWAGAVAPGQAQSAKFTKPVTVAAPAVPPGNNGGAPCALFCAANNPMFGGYLPKNWIGAYAISQQVQNNSPQTSPSQLVTALGVGVGGSTGVACLCAESDTPYLTYAQTPSPYGTGPACPQAGLCN